MHFSLLSAFLISLLMFATFLLATLKRDMSIVDIAWGFGFILIAGAGMIVNFDTLSVRQWIIFLCVVLWGTRLAWHIVRRKRGHGEDARYAALRTTWGTHVMLQSFLKVFLLQGIVLWIIAVPIVVTYFSPNAPFGVMDIVGLILWTFGWIFEIIADQQLAYFKNDPLNKGKILTTGLWKYSRHPNYFGEVLLWWGIALSAFSGTSSLIVFFGPSVLLFLILFVTGIPPLEARYKGNPDFEAYKKTTNAFLPFPPKIQKQLDV